MEQPVHLDIENGGVGVDAAMDAVGLDRLTQIHPHIESHRRSPSLDYAARRLVAGANRLSSRLRRICCSAHLSSSATGAGKPATAMSFSRCTAGQMRTKSFSPAAV